MIHVLNRRVVEPYGTPAGGSSTWIDNRSFVGGADLAINAGALVAGDAVASIATAALVGSEIGVLGGPVGAAAGMLIGAAADALISFAGSQAVSNIVDHPMQTLKSVASDINPFNW